MNTVNDGVGMANIWNCLFPYIYHKNKPSRKLNSAQEGRWTFKPSGTAAPLPGSYSETPVTIHTPQDARARVPDPLAFSVQWEDLTHTGHVLFQRHELKMTPK